MAKAAVTARPTVTGYVEQLEGQRLVLDIPDTDYRLHLVVDGPGLPVGPQRVRPGGTGKGKGRDPGQHHAPRGSPAGQVGWRDGGRLPRDAHGHLQSGYPPQLGRPRPSDKRRDVLRGLPCLGVWSNLRGQTTAGTCDAIRWTTY